MHIPNFFHNWNFLIQKCTPSISSAKLRGDQDSGWECVFRVINNLDLIYSCLAVSRPVYLLRRQRSGLYHSWRILKIVHFQSSCLKSKWTWRDYIDRRHWKWSVYEKELQGHERLYLLYCYDNSLLARSGSIDRCFWHYCSVLIRICCRSDIHMLLVPRYLLLNS
jgi:hypothetical protein